MEPIWKPLEPMLPALRDSQADNARKGTYSQNANEALSITEREIMLAASQNPLRRVYIDRYLAWSIYLSSFNAVRVLYKRAFVLIFYLETPGGIVEIWGVDSRIF